MSLFAFTVWSQTTALVDWLLNAFLMGALILIALFILGLIVCFLTDSLE